MSLTGEALGAVGGRRFLDELGAVVPPPVDPSDGLAAEVAASLAAAALLALLSEFRTRGMEI